MFKNHQLLVSCLTLALFMAGFSNAHAAIVIDTFDGPDQQAPPDNEIDAPSAIGGKRLLSSGLESTGIVSNGLWLSIEGDSPGGVVSVTYRGDGTLGGIDLTEGGLNTAFEIVIAARTAFQGETLALTVDDSGSGNSSFSVNWVDLPLSGSYLIPFSSLAGDADLTSVDIITVFNTMPTIQDDSILMAIGQIRVVPVPAAVWLFGSALGLLGWVRRRAT